MTIRSSDTVLWIIAVFLNQALANPAVPKKLLLLKKEPNPTLVSLLSENPSRVRIKQGTLRPSGTLLFNGLPMMISQKKFCVCLF